MKRILKRSLRNLRKLKKRYRNRQSISEKKALYLGSATGKKRCRKLKAYYKGTVQYKTRWKWIMFLRRFARLKLPLWLSFFRWIIIDFLRGKNNKKFGVFQFVALPGEGKTMSMVAHMERYRKEFLKKGQPCVVRNKTVDNYDSKLDDNLEEKKG